MTQAIQKTLRDSAGMRWTALLLLALAMFCSYIFMDILSPITYQGPDAGDPRLGLHRLRYHAGL